MLLLVHTHTHTVQAARVLQIKNRSSSVVKLTDSVVSNFVHLPDFSSRQSLNVMMEYTSRQKRSCTWFCLA